jgi:crotonobetainyl-CoA:carnitine CoA-transferase CaiB-like acyl-CoA transferase
MGLLDAAWSALGEHPAALPLVRDHGDAVPLDAALPVGRFVHDAIATASLSAALLAARRTGSAVPTVELDPVRVATAVTSERHYRFAGEPMTAWAELSGFWPTADGWVRTHANYPHHQERLLAALGLPAETTADELLVHLHGRSAEVVEALVSDRKGIAVRVATEAEWRASEEAQVIAKQPLIRFERIGDAPAEALAETTVDAPAGGIRVLDLTRVIAGPVATRTLALWGADVLRIDPPQFPEIPAQHLDTGAGKRSAVVDLDAQHELFETLLEGADVVVLGYRSGALDHFGLSPEALAARHPGIVIARLTAWGDVGPFADRRGFDSIVQAASGISWLESSDPQKPGALPAQALDHSAGYLLAAGVTSALRKRLDEGGSWLVETSLARVAAELLDAPREPRAEHPAWLPTVITRGDLTTAAPAPHYDGGPEDWSTPAVPWGTSRAGWLPRADRERAPIAAGRARR